MADSNHTAVTITLVIKTAPEDAVRVAEEKLLMAINDWFAEDTGRKPPFPKGSLLFYRFQLRDTKSPSLNFKSRE